MGFDGFLVPDWAKPYVGWAVGMDWPEGDEAGCFRLADACVTAAHRVVEGTSAEQPWSAGKVGADWDGAAHLAFAEHVAERVGGRAAELVDRLIKAAVALNGVGVQIQYAKYMIEMTVWLLVAQLSYLLAMAVATKGASLLLIGPRVQIARLTIAQIGKLALKNIAIFAGIVAGMDAGIQLAQIAKGRRDELDLRQIGVSALSGGAMGALTGLLSGGLTRLATPALRAGLTKAEMTTMERLLAAAHSSVYGQAAQYAVTGGITTAGTMLAQGDFSWDMLAKGITSSALGADGQHLTTTFPGHGPSSLYGDPPAGVGPGLGPGSRPDVTSGAGVRDGQDSGVAPGSRSGSETQGNDVSGGGPGTVSVQGMPSRVAGAGPVADGGATLSQAGDPGPGAGEGARQASAAPYAGLDRQTYAPPGEARQQSGAEQRTAPGQGGEAAPRSRTPEASQARHTPEASARTSPAANSATGTIRATGTAGDPPAPIRPSEAPGPSRIERLLNHLPDHEPASPARAAGRAEGAVTDRPGEGTSPPAQANGATQPQARTTAPHLTDDGAAPPPGEASRGAADGAVRPGEATGGTGDGASTARLGDGGASEGGAQVARPGDGGSSEGGARAARVPFDFERFYNDPRWYDEATRFEQRLGAYYFNDSRTLDAARTALAKMRDVLMELTPRRPDEGPEAFARRVESVFFKDDPASAGQVGTRAGLTVDDLLAHGNLRELVTAFYNGAYYNRDNPGIFGNALLDIMDTGGWDRARQAGLDVEAVRRAHHQLDERLHRSVLGRLESRFMDGSYTFTRDPFGTGNVGMMSERGARDVVEMVSSQYSRRDRTDAEIQELGLNTTPAHYERLGTPLGRYERAYVEQHTGGRLDPDTPLPWREGATIHHTTSSRWARKVASEGFPVIDGVSGTTAKMLTAVKFLNLGPAMTERFLGALMGWMLPGRDHSLFEIARGAQIAGVGGMRLEPGARPTAVDFYRSLPGIDLTTLRREVLPDGMFPHESRYYTNARDIAGFSETRHHKVTDTVDRLWPQLESGRVTDPDLAAWLDRSGIDPGNPDAVRALGERLSPAHVMALTVYTRHSHYLINNVTRFQLWTDGISESLVRNRMAAKVDQLVGNYLDNIAARTKALPLPLALRPMLHEGASHLTSRSPLNPLADAYVDAVRRSDEAAERFKQARDEGRRDDARQASQDMRAARRDRQHAWDALKEHVGRVVPRLWDEMRWHADMVHDAMMQLPGVGSPEKPVIAYRGDWLSPAQWPIYGAPFYPHGMAREFLSVSRLLEVAIRFMAENPAGDHKVIVAYRLTGGQAKDISVFSSFAEDQEAVFPPRSRMARVDDPEFAARLREDVDRVAADMVERGVIPEVPRSYEIIVMEEG